MSFCLFRSLILLAAIVCGPVIVAAEETTASPVNPPAANPKPTASKSAPPPPVTEQGQVATSGTDEPTNKLRPRTPPTFERWSVHCTNSGLCTASTFLRDQSVWVDLRIVRDWPAEAPPLLRITANAALNGEKSISLSVDNQQIDEIQIAQLRESQQAISAPAGFRPLGGEGFWYPAGPTTSSLIRAMLSGTTLSMDLPIGDQNVTVRLPLAGLHHSLTWLDEQQNRQNTRNAIILTGNSAAKNAPHALPVLDPASLPAAVSEAWDANRFCSDIDPTIFTNLDAVIAPIDEKTKLYLLPCGAPNAYNTPYVALHSVADGKTRQLPVARMSDQGPIATELIYNLRWNAATRELDGLYRGSGIGDCGVWNRWRWTSSGFALIEEASRTTCDGKETPLQDWPLTWPAVTASK
ncbi:DUF1176 domain-containing protein [Roseibium sp.]|uniref:DUF1176 domain-containing protein n=1 Tax=Roseibium sp. TaxID=1936156 RepID=UPI003A97D114